jgi:DNA topoisomerase I
LTPESAAGLPTPPPSDAAHDARSAGLLYANDTLPGITRRRAGRSFSYWAPSGERLTDQARREWIRALAIPPAWTDVWISPRPNGHLLATGRDARGRKQYLYHPRWSEVRDATKYQRMIEFGKLLPLVRERIDADLSQPGLPRQKVIAAVVRLLELTLIRIGNEEYARLNRSFGLTTMRNRHVSVHGTSIRFRFRGKSGKVHEVGIRDRRLASVIRRVQDLPGQDLFEYIDSDGAVQTVESEDVNGYLREITQVDLTAKDYRTWAGTVLAFRAFCSLAPAASESEAKKNLVAAIKIVARNLGNTPAVCRSSYIHPAVIDAYLEGSILDQLDGAGSSGERLPGPDPSGEGAVLELLRRGASQPPRAGRKPEMG